MEGINFKKLFAIGFIFILAYLSGGGIALLYNAYGKESVSNSGIENWGLGFSEDGQPPTANTTSDELRKYDAFFIGDTDKKIIYLTFDAGYENGYTSKILDVLKKHKVPAAFFLVNHYVESCPELVKRMVEEGHIIGNHTYSHPDMSKILTKESFYKEIKDLETSYKRITGQEIGKYYRPPQGKYSEKNLEMAKELGYKTFFWSLAYVDWYDDNQPSHEAAYDKLLARIHPGAIILLHSTSKTNSEILDELLTKWKELGYSFGSLDDFK